MKASDDQRSATEMTAEHFARLRPGATVVFPARRYVWKVAKVVERGAVMYRANDGSHNHLAEWHELALAIIE